MAYVQQLVPAHLPPQVREEVCADLIMAALEKRVTIADLGTLVKKFTSAVFATDAINQWGPLSLDQPLGDEDGRTLKDVIADTVSA